MMIVRHGFISRKTTGAGTGKKHVDATYRNWWLGSYGGTAKNPTIKLGKVKIPNKIAGKRIRFKVQYFDPEEREWKDTKASTK